MAGEGGGGQEAFEARVKRLFRSCLFDAVPDSSFPAVSWSVAAGDVERRRWAKPSEEAVGTRPAPPPSTMPTGASAGGGASPGRRSPARVEQGRAGCGGDGAGAARIQFPLRDPSMEAARGTRSAATPTRYSPLQRLPSH
ncbi:unnamed protein product [Urochloa humidicola]